MDSIEDCYHKYEIKNSSNLLTVGKFDPMNFEYNAKDFNAFTAKCKQFYSAQVY